MQAELTLNEKLATRRALAINARLSRGAESVPPFGPISTESDRQRERRLLAEAERAAMRLGPPRSPAASESAKIQREQNESYSRKYIENRSRCVPARPGYSLLPRLGRQDRIRSTHARAHRASGR